jgi:bifunctional DNA-binding transcriptional regulator/antitoxin component of YhaV-PrlF toxin-antitoxin module
MAAKKRKHGSKSETVRKLTKTGSYTFYVTIPKVYIDELGWKERQNVVVKKSGQKIVIEGLKKAAKKK